MMKAIQEVARIMPSSARIYITTVSGISVSICIALIVPSGGIPSTKISLYLNIKLQAMIIFLF